MSFSVSLKKIWFVWCWVACKSLGLKKLEIVVQKCLVLSSVEELGFEKLQIGVQECLVLNNVEELGFEEATDWCSGVFGVE